MAQTTQTEQMETLRRYIVKSWQEGPDEAITLHPTTYSWSRGQNPVTMSALARRLGILHGISREKAKEYLEQIAEDLHLDMDKELRAKVRKMDEAPECDEEARKFVRLMQRGTTDPLLHECHVWALKQWIWQVKRHVMRLPVTHHIMLVFYSAEQGTGKSHNVRRLCKPLEGFHRSMAVDQLGAQFDNQLMARTYIVEFKEMAGASEAKAAQLKSFLTGRRFEGRSMFSEMGFSGENRVSCIATTNDEPPHGIDNGAGARRMWSIHCTGQKKVQGDERCRAMDALDWTKIWQAVSHRHDSIESILPDDVRRRQAHVREELLSTRDVFDEFLREDVVASEAPQDAITVRRVQAAFKSYASRCSKKASPMRQKDVLNRLIRAGYATSNRANVQHVKGIRLLTFDEDTP